MTSNLALDGGRTLTPADSDVVTNHTLPANITDGTPSEYDTAQIYSGVATNTTETTNGHALASDAPYGNLYNWNAATATVGKQATTGTVYESICPRGWRLPDNTGGKSWSNLLGAYGYPTVNRTDAQDPNTYAYMEAVQQAPFYIPLAGYYYVNATGAQGRSAYLFSRTVYSTTTHANYFYFLTGFGDFYPQGHTDKGSNLHSVRCVFGENSDNIMQNFTQAMCNSLSETTSSADNRKVLQDSRDGKLYNIAKLKDNNCWMVTNLALDGADSQGNVRTLTPSDSNVSSNHDLAKNISDGTTSAYDEPQIFSGKSTIVDQYGSAYGNLYNWNSATATLGKQTTTETVYESICSKGWRLPDAKLTANTKTYASLLTLYGLPIEAQSAEAVATVQQAPLYFPLVGFYADKAHVAGRESYYWTRAYVPNTVENYYAAFALHFNNDNTNFYTEGFPIKSFGMLVRCVFGES